ncbi:MAG: GNAT family N-acetyltransferase [Rubrivivax sp.]|nr:GNAT family N-acetyltransferase [Rubrivivax sp.]
MIVWLTRAEALRSIENDASTIDACTNPANPFCSSVWLHHFITEVVSARDRVAVVEATGNGRSLMYLRPEQPDKGRLSSLSNYYSSLYSPVLSDATDRLGAATGLARALAQSRPRVSTLNLSPLEKGNSENEQFASVLSDAGWFVRPYLCFGNWTLPCEGLTYADYMSSRASQLRNTHSRKAKKLLASGSLEIYTRTDEVDRAMAGFDAAYARSWKQPDPYPNFVRGWAHRCAEHGWLRVGLARIGGAVVAAQFWFTIARRAYIFKLAYDGAYAKWSAGTVLTAYMFQHALDVDKVIEIDFLTGDDPYKESWMTVRRERIGLMACNLATLTGLAVASKEWAGAATKSWRARLQSAAGASSTTSARNLLR